MATPILQIGGYDFTEWVESMTPTGNGLNADGSGRDVETGKMFRTKIADKLKFEVKMLKLPEEVHTLLANAIKATNYTATVLHPDTNMQVSLPFYTDTRPFGAQRYNPSTHKTYYEGMTFNMIEV